MHQADLAAAAERIGRELYEDQPPRISGAYVSLLEKGTANPTARVLHAIARALGTELRVDLDGGPASEAHALLDRLSEDEVQLVRGAIEALGRLRSDPVRGPVVRGMLRAATREAEDGARAARTA